MYSSRLNRDIKDFDICLNYFLSLIESEYENYNIYIPYEEIFETIKYSLFTADKYNISMENYVKFVTQANVAVIKYDKLNGIRAGIFLKTLIIRLCTIVDSKGEIIIVSNNFINKFNKIIDNIKVLNDKKLIEYCSDLIGVRNAEILEILIKEFYP